MSLPLDSISVLHRFLFAILPSAQARQQIDAYNRELGLGGTLVLKDRLHLTVAITNDFVAFPEMIADSMMEIGATVRSPPVQIALGRLSGSERSIALRPERKPAELQMLHDALNGPMRRLGIRRIGWKFSPHVTLRYRVSRPATRSIRPIVWEARDFVLIHSVVGKTRHIELGRWPLIARQGELFD